MTSVKTRIKDLSQELGVSNKEMLQTLRELDIPAKSLMSMIDDEQVQLIRQKLREHNKIVVREEVKPGKVVVRRRRKKGSDTSGDKSQADEAEDLQAEQEESEVSHEEETPQVEEIATEAADAAVEQEQDSEEFENARIVVPAGSEEDAPGGEQADGQEDSTSAESQPVEKAVGDEPEEQTAEKGGIRQSCE